MSAWSTAISSGRQSATRERSSGLYGSSRAASAISICSTRRSHASVYIHTLDFRITSPNLKCAHAIVHIDTSKSLKDSCGLSSCLPNDAILGCDNGVLATLAPPHHQRGRLQPAMHFPSDQKMMRRICGLHSWSINYIVSVYTHSYNLLRRRLK